MMKPMPVGVDSFEELISKQYYYVDKSLLIKELLDMKGKVNLFTRPRRFGKTLNLSMLRCFFEDTGDADKNQSYRDLFHRLKIMDAGEAYLRHMGHYPVISLSLKSARQTSFENARYQIPEDIREEFRRHLPVLSSLSLTESEKEMYKKLMEGSAPDAAYDTSLKYLSRCLAKACGQSIIILLDEYDVPLENAYFHGFYQEMTDFILSLFESALKTNEHLEFAVITGCLRISRESIFTGLNHLNMISILDKQYSEHFGFTETEVQKMMQDYGRSSRFPDMKRWYDGYQFGDTEVYNPWSVIKFIYDLTADEQAFPRPYWANTSSNSIVRSLVQKADPNTKAQIERLLE